MKKQAKHVSSYMNIFLNNLPEEQKRKALIERKVKQVYRQFSACIDPFIADHVNSVYLVKEAVGSKGKKAKESEEVRDVSRETLLKLTVYVDNSLVAAELNAQRELVILKFREQFDVEIDEFDIKISRGAYRENYPLRAKKEESACDAHQLTPEEETAIEQQTAQISDPEIKASFQRVLKATKEHPLKD